MNHRMLAVSLAVLAPACGSSAPALRPLDKGAEVDRFAALQDNLASIIERAESPADASKSLDSYCGAHRADIDAILSGVQRVTAADGAPERERVIESTNRLMSRVDKVGERWSADTTIEQAMRGCLGAPEAAEPTAPSGPPKRGGKISPIGVASCDLVMERYLLCIENVPEAAYEPALAGVVQMRDGWAEALGSAPSPEVSAAVAKVCDDAAATFAENLAALCPAVQWK